MGAHVQCPRCDQAFALSDEQTLLYAGRDFECSQCGTRFVVPRASLKGNVTTSTLRGELPREQVTAGASRAAAPLSPFTPGFIPTGGYVPLNDPEPALGSGLAITALICGVLGLFIPIVPALLAIMLGVWAVVRIQRGKADGASMASGAIALGFAGLVTGTAILYQRVVPAIAMERKASAEGQCSDHFKSIAAGLKRFAAEHQGSFPESIDALVADGIITSDMLVCPFTSDSKATGANAAEIAQHVRLPGHCSYVYTGKGLTTQSSPECVLLYESLEAHHEPGISVLFVDGRVQSIGKIQAAKAVARLAGGQNPPWSD